MKRLSAGGKARRAAAVSSGVLVVALVLLAALGVTGPLAAPAHRTSHRLAVMTKLQRRLKLVVHVPITKATAMRTAPHAKSPARRTTAALASAVCSPANLSITYETMEQYMFHSASIYAVQNTGSATCSLSGYPSVTAMSAGSGTGGPSTMQGVTVNDASTAPFGATSAPVDLAPGTQAGFVIGYVYDPNQPPCAVPTTFDVTLPGTSQSIQLTKTSTNICPGSSSAASVLYVSPILPAPAPPSSS